MSLVGLQRKTTVTTLAPLPIGQLHSCVLNCPMSLASMNHKPNTMKLQCLHVLPLILYVQRNSLVAWMCFRLPISFVNSTKQILPYALDGVTY